MSEQNSGGSPFAEVLDSAGLDIDAIFGGVPNGGTPGNVNPFDMALAQQAAPPAPIPQAQAQKAAPQLMAQQPVPAPPVFQSVHPEQPAPAPAVQPAAPATQPALDIDPLAAAMAEQEVKAEQKAAKSLFEKAPVFHYDSTWFPA